MNHNTVQLISLQHELGMSIGLDLRLRSMLARFSKVCIRQLGLSGMQFFFLHQETGEVALPGCMGNSECHHFLSIPEHFKSELNSNLLRGMESSLLSEFSYQSHYSESVDEYAYHYSIGGFGVAILKRLNRPISKTILELLVPIFDRLAVSCQASIEHEQLLFAVESRLKAEQAMKFQAYHDDLTRLPNRRMFMDTLSKDLSRTRRHGFLGAVLFIDLNRFKAVNDTLGHAVGDRLLVAVANLLTDIVRLEDTVARLSGDEFVVQITDIKKSPDNGRQVVETIVSKILRAFARPISAGGHMLNVTPSIGIEFYPRNGIDADDIIHHADTAMYQAKATTGSTPVYYDSALTKELKLRLALERELHQALESLDQFELHYQPQYNKEGRCVGAEALLRWNNPTRSAVSPAVFVPIAEETGLMMKLGSWVMEEAARHIRILCDSGISDSMCKISVNVSAIQFAQENFVADLLMIMASAGAPTEMLCVELTESTLIKSVEDTVKVMNSLNNQGIGIAIDDFGTGYSSLAYLSRFPIDTLKIDQTFVRDIHKDKGNRAIVGTIMALAGSLDFSIIAEGVETIDELDCLRELHCENYQGYFFSRPIPFQAFHHIICGGNISKSMVS